MTFSEKLADTRGRIAANIRHYRLRKGVTRAQFSEATGINLHTLECAESPHGANLSISSVVHIAQALGVDTSALFERRDLPMLQRGPNGTKQVQQFRKAS